MKEHKLIQEDIDKAEKLISRLTDIEGSAAYAQIVQSTMQIQKDNFEMLDRSLAMMQAVHEVELKSNSFYVDTVKFLIPIFATAAITGAAVNSPSINSTLLIVVGLIGVIVSMITLIPFMVQRHRKIKRQNDEYNKLAKVFSDWQKIADIQKKAANESSSLEDWQNILKDMQSIVNVKEGGR